MRETSRMSEMSWVCARALRSMVSTARATTALSSGPPRRTWAQPTMALSGVRSSWDRVARNSSFIRFASWASRKHPRVVHREADALAEGRRKGEVRRRVAAPGVGRAQGDGAQGPAAGHDGNDHRRAQPPAPQHLHLLRAAGDRLQHGLVHVGVQDGLAGADHAQRGVARLRPIAFPRDVRRRRDRRGRRRRGGRRCDRRRRGRRGSSPRCAARPCARGCAGWCRNRRTR